MRLAAPKSETGVHRSARPTLGIALSAVVALTLGACGDVQTDPGGTGGARPSSSSSTAAGGAGAGGAGTTSSTGGAGGNGGAGGPGTTSSSGGAAGRAGAGGGTDTDACESDDYCQGLYSDYYWCWYPRITPCIERVCHGTLLPCASDSKCEASLGPVAVCNACPTEGKCGWKCATDADCGPAATCDGQGRCLMQTCEHAGDCPVNFDCTDRGDAAFGKHCMRRPCTSASDCPGGYCVGLPHFGFCFEERGRCHDCT